MANNAVDKARVEEVRENIEHRIRREFGISARNATIEQVYRAVALCVRDEAADVWAGGREQSQEDGRKCLIYLSAEYLIGRALTNNLVNLGRYDEYAAALSEIGFDIGAVEEQEADAGLGNGGLGRLAACFLDSLATLEMPAIGYGIRYEYGFFRQEIRDGRQVEAPDPWEATGDVWQTKRTDRVFEVRFGGSVEECWSEDGHLNVVYHGAQSVFAEANDMPILGYDSKLPATLRLWRARAPQQIAVLQPRVSGYRDRLLLPGLQQFLLPAPQGVPLGAGLRLAVVRFQNSEIPLSESTFINDLCICFSQQNV